MQSLPLPRPGSRIITQLEVKPVTTEKVIVGPFEHNTAPRISVRYRNVEPQDSVVRHIARIDIGRRYKLAYFSGTTETGRSP